MSHGVRPTSRRCTQRRILMVAFMRLSLLLRAVLLVLIGALLFSRFFFFSLTTDTMDNKEKQTLLRSHSYESPTTRDMDVNAPRRAATVLYHQARTDRSGAVIHDMLLAHAYAYQQNLTYGGACYSNSNRNTTLPHITEHEIMIETLRLSHVLKFACPHTGRHSPGDTGALLLTDRHRYTRFGTRLWTREWLDHIRSQQHSIVLSTEPSERKKTVVVHIRRGDVSLCDPITRDRYLPNQHYQTLLEGYGDNYNVTVFSESKSPESWNDFENYNLQLDTSPAEVWKAMLDANVLILSKSSFSIVPAVFNRHGLVVYTPFWVEPPPLTFTAESQHGRWKVVDDDTMRTTQRAELRLRSQLCRTLPESGIIPPPLHATNGAT
jgi:hypothetical protein